MTETRRRVRGAHVNLARSARALKEDALGLQTAIQNRGIDHTDDLSRHVERIVQRAVTLETDARKHRRLRWIIGMAAAAALRWLTRVLWDHGVLKP